MILLLMNIFLVDVVEGHGIIQQFSQTYTVLYLRISLLLPSKKYMK